MTWSMMNDYLYYYAYFSWWMQIYSTAHQPAHKLKRTKIISEQNKKGACFFVVRILRGGGVDTFCVESGTHYYLQKIVPFFTFPTSITSPPSLKPNYS